MSDFLNDITNLFERDLNNFIVNIRLIPDNHLWDKPEGVPNSCGVLAQHIAGNLKSYVGYHICDVPYTRDRDAEFRQSDKTLSDLVIEIEEARDIIVKNLPDTSPAHLDDPFTGKFPIPMNNRNMLINLLGHLNYHMGQLNYLRRIL